MSNFRHPSSPAIKYCGVPFPYYIKEDSLDRIRQYTFDSKDVFVAAFLRSGTNWMAAMVTFILSGGHFNENPFDYMESPLTPESETTFDLFVKNPAPRYFKTHLPFSFLEGCFKRSRPKVICVMRNPFDQLVSYYNLYRMYRPWGYFTGSWDQFYSDVYKQGKVFYGDYFDQVAGWWDVREEHKDHILYVKYEDLHRDTRQGVHRVAAFLGKELSEEAITTILEQTSFKNMQQNPKLNMTDCPNNDTSIVPFIRKGVVGDWRNHFNAEQEKEIYELYRQHILSRGLHFDLGSEEMNRKNIN